MIGTLRMGARPAARQMMSRRGYSTGGDLVGDAFVKQREATKHHAAGSSDMWRKITFYVALPAIAIGYLNAQNLLHEHEAHIEHIKEENGGELPDRIQYDYMNRRNKSFPWGNETLFYNPKANLPPPE